MQSARHDAALGALLGALVGDAAGGVLEFFGRAIEAEDVATALEFPGGGVHMLAPGQITDDGELTLALARGLTHIGPPTASAPPEVMNAVAAEYARWYASNPFDIGNTTAAAFGVVSARELESGTAAQAMRVAARGRNTGSKANGSVMRATPLAIWGHSLAPESLAKWAWHDSELSHPNRSCCDAVAVYAIAIAHLIAKPKDADGAIRAAEDWCFAHGCEEVQAWLRQGLAGEPEATTPLMGFVKIAITHAFHHLAAGTKYSDAIEAVIFRGGDTDTNACIVGGLLGARWGAEAIPADWKRAALECNTASGQSRPDWLHASCAPDLVDTLLKLATLAR